MSSRRGALNWRKGLDVLLLAALSLAWWGGAVGKIIWLQAAAGGVLTFGMTGWLFVRLLFGERPFELEVEVLLIVFVSSFLVSLQVLALSFAGVALTKDLVAIVVTATAWLLMILLKVNLIFLNRGREFHARPHWVSLLAALGLPLILFGFGLLHVHETRESFTELYVVEPEKVDQEQITLVAESYEADVQLFTVVCQAQTGGRVVMGTFEIRPGQQQHIFVRYRQANYQTGKLQIVLDQHRGTAAYRRVEIPGADCSQITVDLP